MKTIIGIVVALGLVLGLSSPVFATECTSLIQQIEEKMEAAELSDDQRDQVANLVAEGEGLHEEGNHDRAVEVLKQALAIVGG